MLNASLDVAGCYQAITELRLQEKVVRRDLRGVLQERERLRNAVLTDIRITDNGEELRVIRRNLDRPAKGGESCLGVTERLLDRKSVV